MNNIFIRFNGLLILSQFAADAGVFGINLDISDEDDAIRKSITYSLS
jgi:hypothetical protein